MEEELLKCGCGLINIRIRIVFIHSKLEGFLFKTHAILWFNECNAQNAVGSSVELNLYHGVE